MKSIVLNILVAIGVGIIALGMWAAFFVTIAYLQYPESSWSHPPIDDLIGLSFVVAFLFGLIGEALAIVAGAYAKPRFLWILFITIGLLYCLSVSGTFYQTYKYAQYPQSQPHYGDGGIGDYLFDSIFLLPGLILIAAGSIMRIRKNKMLQ